MMATEAVILVHGKPGAGKSTLCQGALREAKTWTQGIRAQHLSVGQRFRSILTGETHSDYYRAVQTAVTNSKEAVPSMALHPHSLVQGIVEEYLASHQQTGITLIDGYPKEPELIPVIGEAIKDSKLTLIGCIALNVSDETAVRRQLARLDTDGHPLYDEITARQRVAAHNSDVVPVLTALGQTYGQVSIYGEQTSENVLAEFTRILGQCVLER
jgi:adenylate kinase family enzyme